MSQEQPLTDSSFTETVFEELGQELRRLKSAVSHLTLSESAATQAITAAEQVVERQAQLSRQLSDYVSRLPQPRTSETATQVVDRLVASHAESHNSQGNEEHYQRVLARLEEHQGQLAQMLTKVEQQLMQGVAHHLSQELEGLRQQTVQDVGAAQQYGQVLGQLQQHTHAIREQQHKVSLQLETLSAGWPGQSRQLEELRKAVQTVGQQFSEQVAQQHRMPAEWQNQLQQALAPLMKPKAQLTLAPDHELRRKVDELQQTVAVQQGLLKRQQVIGLVTLLAALAGLVIAFLGE
ncbi:hypothetical protein LRS06_11375 [Hymenobacter sp. J193]|uniref:hypothetical protein n=1 Tax=Hymenobacter sp. J193 TaxID=2898429 RepID=UPI002150F208|nr:hypothetical protein [Hymenobacter sp. J193]MCR5888353.1 hypothetical protein [Hymenobacter sp. J193]